MQLMGMQILYNYAFESCQKDMDLLGIRNRSSATHRSTHSHFNTNHAPYRTSTRRTFLCAFVYSKFIVRTLSSSMYGSSRHRVPVLSLQYHWRVSG